MARTRYRHDSSEPPLFALPAAAMRAVLSEGYSWQAFRRDAFAGVVVGMVALPLAMALAIAAGIPPQYGLYTRSEEHTSELQSRENLVCRLLLEKKKRK